MAKRLTANTVAKGYTAFLIQELHRYSRRDRPLRIYLAWPEHRRVAVDKLQQQQEELGLYGEIVYLDPDGNSIDFNRELGAPPSPVADAALVSKSLTALRHFMVKDSQARILLGGRRTGFPHFPASWRKRWSPLSIGSRSTWLGDLGA